MVVIRVWDLKGEFPLGTRRVELDVLRRAESLAPEREAVVVDGLPRVALRDLDLAQVEVEDLHWMKANERESGLPRGYYLDSEQGLMKDPTQVHEMELG